VPLQYNWRISSRTIPKQNGGGGTTWLNVWFGTCLAGRVEGADY